MHADPEVTKINGGSGLAREGVSPVTTSVQDWPGCSIDCTFMKPQAR